ncbi:hypothetical protein B296_00048631 [Ensete ventricosum]|uniref:Uncharacterized protein n=1 Tax=Ensete ventricosum TaxID=4639 RepID=A0A426YC72_ENSVE|nr:hypothetical protein B296_00048631 [Ensete ventricosum]
MPVTCFTYFFLFAPTELDKTRAGVAPAVEGSAADAGPISRSLAAATWKRKQLDQENEPPGARNGGGTSLDLQAHWRCSSTTASGEGRRTRGRV